MKVKLDTQLLGVDGTPLELEKGKPATVGAVAIEALLAGFRDDTETQKLQHYDIYKKIETANDNEIGLSTEEISILKSAVGRLYYPMIIGRFRDAVDPQD